MRAVRRRAAGAFGLVGLVGLVGLAGCASPAVATGNPAGTVPASSATAGAVDPAATRSASAKVAPPASAAASASAGQFHAARDYTPVALPVRLRIPEAGVDASVVQVGLTPQGWIQAPTDWDVAAWYEGGPRPGQEGPAVIVGHIDSRSGPAVFQRLPTLRMGASIQVERQDGTSVTFRVASRRQVAKQNFPAADIYTPTLKSSLILITCGGLFDRTTGHYRDNIVVTAVPG